MILGSILFCTGCTNSQEIVTSKIGSITEKDVNANLKEQFGNIVLYQMTVRKVLLHEYPVPDHELNEKLEFVKKQTNKTLDEAAKQIGLANEQALKEHVKVQLAIEKAVKKSITENDLKDYYKPEIKVSHILVADEKQAKDIVEKLKNGEDFVSLVKQYSIDNISKEKGGDLGFLSPGSMEKAFEDAAYKLQIGEISPPIKTSSGYHVIKLVERKELPPFEQEKENIQKKLESIRLNDQVWQEKFVQNLFEKANVKVNDPTYKDALHNKKFS